MVLLARQLHTRDDRVAAGRRKSREQALADAKAARHGQDLDVWIPFAFREQDVERTIRATHVDEDQLDLDVLPGEDGVHAREQGGKHVRFVAEGKDHRHQDAPAAIVAALGWNGMVIAPGTSLPGDGNQCMPQGFSPESCRALGASVAAMGVQIQSAGVSTLGDVVPRDESLPIAPRTSVPVIFVDPTGKHPFFAGAFRRIQQIHAVDVHENPFHSRSRSARLPSANASSIGSRAARP